MKVAYLVAGAGRMYCGACMRDNRVAARLVQQGRDVVLIPLYTPIRTDEVDVSERRVYYGGLNVFLQQKSAFFRHLPRPINRLLDSNPLLRFLGRFVGKTRAEDLGPLTVSVLAGENGAQRRELEKLVAALADLRPTLVHLPNLMFVGVVCSIKATLKVPVLCTLAGEDVFIDALAEPHRSEAYRLIRQAVSGVDAFVAPTRYYASHATERFGLDVSRVHYAPMGIQVDDTAPALDPPPNPFTIGYLAAVCPEKGLATLCDAYAVLKRRETDCRLRIAGYVGQAGWRYWNEIHERLSAGGISDSVDFLGEVTGAQKEVFLRSLHVLSVPTVYPEAKGLYVLEAMASGVPVVQPRHGSFPELVEDTGGGILYDPSGPEALADAIGKLINDQSLRQRLADSGRSAVRRMYTDEVMAERTWSLYETLGQRGAVPAVAGASQATGG